MAPPWRILDRLMLGTGWPALCGAVAFAVLGSLIGGPMLGLTAGPFALGVGLTVVYGIMAHSGEYAAPVQAGIAPRRIGAIVVACALALALVEAMIACALFRYTCLSTRYAVMSASTV